MNDLIVVENVNAVELFTKDGVGPILSKIKEEVRKFKPDMTSVSGRKEIASMAHKVAKSKTYLDDLGKKLVEDQKRSIKIVDESRKKIRDELDALKEEVRKPLTDWEEKEIDRIQNHKAVIQEINDIMLKQYKTSDEVEYDIFNLAQKVIDDSYEEFKDLALETQKTVSDFLSNKFRELKKIESEQEELLKLRQEAAKREQEDREKKIAEDAAKNAKIEAEKKAKEQELKLEKEKADAIKKQKQAEENARLSEQKRIDDLKKAEEEKRLAEKRAIENERKRIKEQKDKEEVEQKRREADIEHKRKINSMAINSLKEQLGYDEEQSKTLLIAIAKGLIANVSIKY